MKQLRFLFSFLAIASLAAMTSCGDDETPQPTTPDECAAETFPTETEAGGTATVSFLNFNTDVNDDEIVEIQAQAGDVLSFAVSITKGTTRPQKLRVYETECPNVVGNIVTFTGQGFEDGGKRIDLRNTDEAQERNVNYIVPTGMSPIYLNFEVDESNGKVTYKRAIITVSGSGVIDSWAGIELGGNSNTLASRMSSGTGRTYEACNAAANINYVDITYAVKTTTPFTSYISSNPARFIAPISLGTSVASCGEDGDLSTAGGQPAYFKPYTDGVAYANVTDATLAGLTVSSANNQYVEVTGNTNVFEFLTTNGRKGLIYVTAVNQLNNTAGSITVSVRVQR